MKIRLATMGRRALKEESGQVFAITGLGALLLVGLAGLAIEVGHGYYALELLQASTDEATLAAAAGLPDATQATTIATDYSSKANQNNAIGILGNVVLQVAPFCSATVSNNYNVPCQTAPGATSAYNAVKVTQTATTGLWIGQMFGTPLFNLEAIGTAAMAGGNYTPYNVAIIVDTTGTMNNNDTSGDCGSTTVTSENCALQGVQTLLQTAYPCAAGELCTDSAASPDDLVSLFVFPMITGASGADDSNCGSTNTTSVAYTLPTHSAETFNTSGVPSGGNGYQVLTFGAGATYRSTDTSPLRSGDILAQAAAANGCPGLRAPGGRGTYIAQVIYEAGEALQQEQAARPGSNNVMIILSDGNMDAVGNYTWSNSSSCTGTITGLQPTSYSPNSTCQANGTLGPSEMQPANGVLTPTSSAPNNAYSQINGTKVPAWSAQANIYTYPSLVGQCGQSVQAAYDVAHQQTVTYSTLDGTSTTLTLNNSDSTKYTQVYTVAYQAPNNSNGAGSQTAGNPQSTSSTQSCFSDIPYNVSTNWWTSCTASTCTATITTGGGTWPTGEAGYGPTGAGGVSVASGSPCASLAAMATLPKYFYSDQGAGCPVTSAGNAINPNGTTGGLTTMKQIFKNIVNSFSSPKLIPIGTT